MLLKKIEEKISDENESIVALLFDAKILGSRLRNDVLKNWADNELNGYEDSDSIPIYRKKISGLYGKFVGAFGSGIDNARIPFSLFDEKDQKIFNSDVIVYQSISSIEDSLKDSKNLSFSLPYNGDQIIYLNLLLSEKRIYEGYQCLAAWKILTRGQLLDIVSNVKNKLLDIVLELQEKFPEDITDDKLTKIPQDQSQQIVTYNIYGGIIGNIASGKNISQKIEKISPGDFKDLESKLKKIQVTESDIEKLKDALQKDNKKSTGKIGVEVKMWLKKISGKMIDSGSTKLINLIEEYIKNYLGVI